MRSDRGVDTPDGDFAPTYTFRGGWGDVVRVWGPLTRFGGIRPEPWPLPCDALGRGRGLDLDLGLGLGFGLDLDLGLGAFPWRR